MKSSSFCLLFCLFCTYISAQQSYRLTKNDVQIVDNTIVEAFIPRGCEADIIIPSEIDGVSITAIGDNAFAALGHKWPIESVIIEEGIKSIGVKAFMRNSISRLTLPNSLEQICDSAFFEQEYSAIEKLVLPSNLKSLGVAAFCNCAVDEVVFECSLKNIPYAAFEYSFMMKMKLPEGIEVISDNAFAKCSLEVVVIPNTVKYLSGFNENFITEIDIPSSVEEIGNYAFAGNKITSLKIHNNVKRIGDRAFSGHKFSKLHIPSTLKHIGKYAFASPVYNNPILDLTFDDDITTIDTLAFCHCSVKSITLPQSLTTLRSGALRSVISYPVQMSIDLPAKLHEIEQSALSNNYIRSVELKDVKLGDSSLAETTYLKDIVIGKGVYEIGANCFACEETLRYMNVDLSGAVDLVNIKPNAFADPSPINVALPENRQWCAYDGNPDNIVEVNVTHIKNANWGYKEYKSTPVEGLKVNAPHWELYDVLGRRASSTSRGIMFRKRDNEGKKVLVKQTNF